MDFSCSGKSTDNPLTGSFDGSPRDQYLNIHWFLSLENAQEKLDRWRRQYNHERSPSALNIMTPAEFIRSLHKDEDLWYWAELMLGQDHQNQHSQKRVELK